MYHFHYMIIILGADERDGGKGKSRQTFINIVIKFSCFNSLNQVPFINYNNAWFIFRDDVIAQFFVYLGHLERGVNKKERYVCPADRPFGARHAVKFYRIMDLSFLSYPCRVNCKELFTFYLEPHINRIPRSAWHFTDDYTLFLCQGIDERRFPGVPLANNGKFHDGFSGI